MYGKRNGADSQNRTDDLTLTKGMLYQLSYISVGYVSLHNMVYGDQFECKYISL